MAKAKPQSTDSVEAKPKKVLVFFKSEGAYGMREYEIDEADLQKHGKLISSSEPDIFAIFLTQLTKKAREIFEI